MKSILILEPDASIRQSIKKIIESMGFCAVECGDIDSAIKLMQNNLTPALLICEEKSRQLISEMRKNDKLANIPIIAMSSYVGVRRIAALLEEGANAFICKPFQKDDLLEYVLRYID